MVLLDSAFLSTLQVRARPRHSSTVQSSLIREVDKYTVVHTVLKAAPILNNTLSLDIMETNGVKAHLFRLQGKVAIITGGASGIGEETVRLFAAEGAKLIIVDVNDTAGEKLAQEVGGPDVARYFHCDVTKEDQIAAAVDLSVSAYGGLDIMFNNAGIIGPRCPIDETPTEELDILYSINLRGVFLGIKHAAKIMKAAQKGTIISTASVAAHSGGQASHGYTTFKHALVGLTRSAAFELRKYQIRVNAVSPGGVLTNIWNEIPNGLSKIESVYSSEAGLTSSVTSANNIANVVLFLASDDAAYVSGQTLLVDGSHTLSPNTPHVGLFGL